MKRKSGKLQVVGHLGCKAEAYMWKNQMTFQPSDAILGASRSSSSVYLKTHFLACFSPSCLFPSYPSIFSPKQEAVFAVSSPNQIYLPYEVFSDAKQNILVFARTIFRPVLPSLKTAQPPPNEVTMHRVHPLPLHLCK